MYRIRLALENTQTGDSQMLIYQFDPATLTQAKWSAAFPAVSAALQALVAASTPKEPATW